MRLRSILLATSMVVGGAAIAWPDEVLPLASRLVAPLVAQSPELESEAGVEEELPAFVGSPEHLAPNGTAPPAAAAVPPNPDTANSDVALAAPGAAAAPEALTGKPADAAVTDQSEPDAQAAAQPLTAETSKDAGPTVAAVKAEESPLELPAAQPIVPAKKLFGAVKGPSLLQARAIGTYSRGCIAGAAALPVDGPAWQAMRLSRNRNWGHPTLINLVENLATSAQKAGDWPGLLVGDISQPRGGPMLTGHASHQLGLDADIWLTPMPDRKLTRKEREEISATSMLDSTDLAVDPKVFTDNHLKLLKRAASYPQVERVLVHPAIKKALCQQAGADRHWLGKVRPIQGHYYHFHIRIGCPPGSIGCVPQKATTGEDGCGKEVDDWLARLARAKLPPAPKPPGWKPSPPRPDIAITQLPADCKMVLESGADGIVVPPEAYQTVAPVPPKYAGKGKREPIVKATVVLKPARERRASQ